MDRSQSVLRPILLISLLALPAVAVRVLSYFSGDPYLQPLALTAEGLAKVGEGGTAYGLKPIRVEVDWGRDRQGQMTQGELRAVIARALASQTDLYRFTFRDVPGADIGVSFTVGANRYGPFPPGEMVDGLHTALIALNMTNRPRR